MIIGVDIDEVVAEYIENLNEFLKEEKGIIRTREDYADPNWFGWLQLPKDEKIKFINEWRFSKRFDNMSIVKDSQEVLTELAKKHTIIFITSRLPDIKESTENWLKKYFNFEYRVIYAYNPFAISTQTNLNSKSTLCKENNIEIVIEDSEHLALDYVKAQMPVILLTQPWNKSLSHPLITRVNNWKEIKETLEKRT